MGLSLVPGLRQQELDEAGPGQELKGTAMSRGTHAITPMSTAEIRHLSDRRAATDRAPAHAPPTSRVSTVPCPRALDPARPPFQMDPGAGVSGESLKQDLPGRVCPQEEVTGKAGALSASQAPGF